MQPDQDPKQTDTRRQFIEFLQQQQLLIQQRLQQTFNRLPLLPDPNLTQNTNPNWDTLNFSVAVPTSDSLSPTFTSSFKDASLADNWSDAQLSQFYQDYLQSEQEDNDDDRDDEKDAGVRTPAPNTYLYDNPATSDFVKKLYRMLEEPTFQPVVCWGALGDCFIVKDMQKCTESVLPRLFKHSNFSSFVRQLNKYGFHKVKCTNDNQYGEHSWVFRHPDFCAGQPEALEKIKRKPSAERKTAHKSKSGAPAAGPSGSFSLSPTVTKPPLCHGSSLPQEQLTPTALSQDLKERLATLEHNQEGLLGEISHFQQELVERNELLLNLIAQFTQIFNAGSIEASRGASTSNRDPSQGYPDPSLQPSDLGLVAQQLPLADMVQQPGSASSSPYRLIQPSFNAGESDLLSFPEFLPQSTLNRTRTHRRYSANNG